MSGATEEGKVSGIYKSTSALIRTGKGRLWGITASGFSATAAVVKIYDNTSASGTVIWQCSFALTTAGTTVVDIDLHGLTFETGCYMEFSGAGAVGISLIYS